jgi:AP-4 complex subunit epsilon-1
VLYRPIVRRKCALFVHRIYLKNPDDLPNIVELSKRFLCDQDPSVMSASIPLIIDVTKRSVGLFKNSVDTFKNIFTQIIEGRLGKAQNYRSVPAPFIQLKLLKFFAVLGENDQKVSEQIYPIIETILKKPESTADIQLCLPVFFKSFFFLFFFFFLCSYSLRSHPNIN